MRSTARLPQPIIELIDNATFIPRADNPKSFDVDGFGRVRITWDACYECLACENLDTVTDERRRNNLIRYIHGLARKLNCAVCAA